MPTSFSYLVLALTKLSIEAENARTVVANKLKAIENLVNRVLFFDLFGQEAVD